MKYLILLAALLAGCNAGETIAPPGVDSFGDSISIGVAVATRTDLYGQIDFRHDPYETGGVTPDPQHKAFYSHEVVIHAHNNGCSATLIHALNARLPGTYYAAIVLAVGYHDLQLDVNPECGGVSVETYRANMEKAVEIAQAHAAVVIVSDIAPIPAGLRLPVNAQAPYDQALHELARQHGAYIFSPEWPMQRVDGVHFSGPGYAAIGKQLADCVEISLSGGDSEMCHH